MSTNVAQVADESAVKKVKKKTKRNVAQARCYIQSTFNNTIISFTDGVGNVIAWSSAGSKGFRGSRKNTPFAAQVAGEDAAQKAVECGVKTVEVFVNGPGAGRESAIRGILAGGFRITSISDTTPIPHNGCRAPKRRRV